MSTPPIKAALPSLPRRRRNRPGGATFILTQLDLYNWGPFSGRHCAMIDLDGTAIIGQTGSGKTSLVDALMTLITAQPRYNLASTGGHESDRDLVSYVRGVTGAGRAGDTDHIARPGKTITGIAAQFDNGERQVCIAAIMALEGSSSALADLERLWLFHEGADQGLDEWLEVFHNGGKRALKQLKRDMPNLDVWDNKKAYIAQLRRFFDVGENAFTLLNRAAGLKQLNSIDELFRELVLDDRAAFQRASEVATEFDDLASIHAELQIAQRQKQSLLPIAQTAREHTELLKRHEEARALLTLIPICHARRGAELWQQQCHSLEQSLATRRQQIKSLEHQLTAQEQQETQLQEQYWQSGGGDIDFLKAQLELQQKTCINRHQAQHQYVNAMRSLNLDPALDANLFGNQRLQIDSLKKETEGQRDQLESETWNLGAKKQALQDELQALEQEIAEIRTRPGSNVPPIHQQFRSELASQLKLTEAALPFVAELIEVQAEAQPWRGAIERALGAQRLRLMVPSTAMQAALRWVNGRNNRLHVRLLEVATHVAPFQFLDDGFTHKLNFKPHPYQNALKHFLASLDRHCVASTEILAHTPHAMTAQGLMSGKRGLFEKQDQTPLQQGWLTGFDNKDYLASRNIEAATIRTQLEKQESLFQASRKQVSALSQRLILLQQLGALQFADIDVASAEQDRAALSARLNSLVAPDSDTGRFKLALDKIQGEIKSTRQKREQALISASHLEQQHGEALAQHQRCLRRSATLSPAQQELAERHFKLQTLQEVQALADHEENTQRYWLGKEQDISKTVGTCERRLVSQMGVAQKEDRGALAEVGTELEDVPHYLDCLQRLINEALPEKEKRFLAYLNQSSDQGVTQLLSSIDNEVSIIEARIDDLNATMRRVDFQPGHYLRLEPRRVIHESLKTLQQAQRSLRSAALQDDAGESHYRALANLVSLLRDASERRTTVGARALLDPRYRLQFAVSVINRDGDKVMETRNSSQGGSGGEKEIIASYILTASLSYALCPEGSNRPLFGTIILDEAFSKSSQAVAGRIIMALREFGLHPLFVTPNKEMRLLRHHTRSAILIHRKGSHASMTSLSWEELDQLAQTRLLTSRAAS